MTFKFPLRQLSGTDDQGLRHKWPSALPLHLAVVLLVASGTTIAQELRLRTETDVFQVLSVDFEPVTPGSNSRLNFSFGFSTQELPQMGTFADSVTFTLSANNQTAYILTADTHGVSWAPLTSGGLEFDPLLIQRSPIEYANPPFPNSLAFSVSFLLPSELEGQPLTLDFSLFNNQDSFLSEAFLLDPVIVPEPGVLTLLALGLAPFWFARKRRAIF